MLLMRIFHVILQFTPGILPFKVLFWCLFFLAASGTNDFEWQTLLMHQGKPGPLLLKEGKEGKERPEDGTGNPK